MTGGASFTVSDHDGVLVGPVRHPENFSKNAVGSIHDDDSAKALGFRGGTVAANIHFEQFPPLINAAFGQDWLRNGGLSLFSLNATTDGEPVQACVGPVEVRADGGRRAKAWMVTPAGVRVSEGSASIGGPDEASALREKLRAVRPPGNLRILAGSRVGDGVFNIPSRLESAATAPRLASITETMTAYTDPGPYGGLVAAPSVAIDALRAVEGPLFRLNGPVVGLFGAIELQYLDGPIFIDRDYLTDGRVVALSDSPKTEVVWYESVLRPACGGAPVARLIMMSRLLKASSPLWAQ